MTDLCMPLDARAVERADAATMSLARAKKEAHIAAGKADMALTSAWANAYVIAVMEHNDDR